jgi:acyl-CoA thioester hydrolase
MGHRTTLRVRYGETDQMGVVYHGSYVAYVECGRTEFMRSRGIHYKVMESEGLMLAVVEIGLRYLRPARYDEELAVETRLAAASGVQLRFEYRIVRNDGDQETVLAEAHTVLACVGRDGRPTRIRSPWREQLAALVDG